MEHHVTLPAGRDWRSTALVTAGLAALELVLLVVLAVAAFGLPFADEREALLRTATGEPATHAEAAGPAKESKPAAQAAAIQARSETSVVVLNGNGVSGAADVASGQVRELRYIVTGSANAPRADFARTIVMYRPGFEGEAHRLAKDVRAKRVAPLDGLRASDLMGAHVALILGRK